MKKYITIIICLFALLCSASAYAASMDVNVEIVRGSTNVKGSVTIAGATSPVAVTVTVKDEEGGLNYIDIIMTDENGLANFEYNNLGESGDYNFVFSAEALNLEKTATIEDFKGYDYWENFLLRVSAAARNNDFLEMKSLIITEAGELLNLDLLGSGYNALADKDEVFKVMIRNCTEYTSQTKIIKEFYAATKLCEYNLNKSPEALKQIYIQENTMSLFDLYSKIPKDTSLDENVIINTVLESLPESVRDKVYQQIAGIEGLEKASDLTDAFVVYTLTGAIKNADHYGTVKTVITAYSNAGYLNLNIKPQNLDAVCKELMHESFKDIKAVEDFANDTARKIENNNKPNSSSGGGGGVSTTIIVPTNKLDPIENNQYQDLYQSGEMYFSDMEDSKWALEAVNLLFKNGIVSGIGGNKFEPNRPVTRAEMAKMAVDTSRIPKVTDGPYFMDVSENDWFYSYVMTACREGIFVGRGEDMFASNASITREEAAVVIFRMVNHKLTYNAETEEVFDDDGSISPWAREAVYALRSNGIMTGRSTAEFCPGEVLTRAEAAVLFSKIMKYFV